MKDYKIVRMNIRVPDYIRDWYKEKGESYSVPYTNYISMLLTQIYEKEEEKELVKKFSEVMESLKETAGDVTTEDMMNEIKEMKDLFKDIEK